MIAASDALEFIPRGRQAVEEHPGPLYKKKQRNIPNEHVLLHRLQNVNISSDEDFNESWSVREIYRDLHDSNLKENETDSRPASPNYMVDFIINSEEELYVKGYTAVWSKGIMYEPDMNLPKKCFTCDTPIKFAFFCHDSFLKTDDKKFDEKPNILEEKIGSIAMIDGTSLRTYSSDGEMFQVSMEFPVSHVWHTKYGIMLEKEASSTIVQFQSISMPRVFSLSHPLDEICPVLSKSHVGTISYMTEAEFRIIFTTPENDMVLMYDNKIGKHFVAKLRKASLDEIQAVSGTNENSVSGFTISNRAGVNSVSQSSTKPSAFMKNTSSILGKSTPVNITHSPHLGKFPTNAPASATSNRTGVQSPLTRLQSSIGGHSMSIQDIRKIGQTEPSKPILPELILEHIWTESTIGRDFPEEAYKAFMHVDIVAQRHLCYLLQRSCKLILTRIDKPDSLDKQTFGLVSTIPARDAVCLDRLKMMVVLAPCGTILLYTGPVMVSKVHIPGIIVSTVPTASTAPSFSSGFPRRSSLLPTVLPSVESNFEDELHLLSPVHPLQPQPKTGLNLSVSLRDPAGNRFTLVYPGGKMYRIVMPYISETPLVSKSIMVLRQILPKELFVQMFVKWFGIRNAPGAPDFSCEQEWERFKTALSELIGRSLSSNESATNSGSEEPKKRRKEEDENGTDEDWEYLLSRITPSFVKDTSHLILHNDVNAPLFSNIPTIFYALHLLYEDLKLDSDMYEMLRHLVAFLHQLASEMQLHSYCLHYFLDFPDLVQVTTSNFFTEQDAQRMSNKDVLQEPVPNIFKQIVNIIEGDESYQYPYIYNVNNMSRNIVQLVSLIIHGVSKCKTFYRLREFVGLSKRRKQMKRVLSPSWTKSEQLISLLMQMNIEPQDIEHLPGAIHFLIVQGLEPSRLSPPIGWKSAAYELILRSELSSLANNETSGSRKQNLSPYRMTQSDEKETSLSPRISAPNELIIIGDDSKVDEDGMEHIDTQLLRLRFPKDLRVAEVCRMLNSSQPALIDITQSLGVTDHDFIEEQERQLYALCTRTMALPMGRGMFTLRTTTPTSTESMPIPKLCLTGKEPIKGATIEMQQIEVPPNMNLWPSFHNGVAAGLRVMPNAKDIDSTWIVYNKPKGQTDISTEHAGFLMALGLNGHLKTLSFMSIYDYLVKCDEMTSIGLLLGISATHRGTMDATTTKLLSVHIEALLPATALELDISQNIQVTSLMGVGLVYQGTAKRHIAEVLLQEIGRPPGPEMENSVERESYALTAGLALGLVTLGQEENPPGLRDLQLPDTLHYYMVGGNKRPLTGSQKEKYKLASFQVREGDTVNIDVTAPGATLALGLMYFNTGNQAVAAWMKPPDTNYLLDLIRPDLLLLRIIARGLILWSDIEPTSDWLFSQFPASLDFDVRRGPDDMNADVDHEAITQAYCNIIAGAAFCIGLRYAGTENQVAFKTLSKTMHIFLNLNGQYLVEYAGKVSVENSLMLILLSMSLVFAGTGNLDILRLIRYLRSRIGTSNAHVTYGSQMAIHMALGFLFLGAGRFTLSRRPEAIAALVCALFPKFPNHSNDNRYHLQAFRHLYVLAVEPRLFLPRDIDTGKLCLCQISVVDLATNEKRDLPMAPCMLPELSTLKSIIINDPNYWSFSFEKGRNWDQLLKVLENCEPIDIQQRAGCLSHLEDPDRLKCMLAQTLTSEQYSCWKIDTKALLSFSSDYRVVIFTEMFLFPEDYKKPVSRDEMERIQLLMIMFYTCLRRDKMHVFEICLSMFFALTRLTENVDVWQIKIIKAYQRCRNDDILQIKEILNAVVAKMSTIMDAWCSKHLSVLNHIVTSPNMDALKCIPVDSLNEITSVMIYYDLIPNIVSSVDLSGHVNYLRLLYEFNRLKLDSDTIRCLGKLINVN